MYGLPPIVTTVKIHRPRRRDGKPNILGTGKRRYSHFDMTFLFGEMPTLMYRPGNQAVCISIQLSISGSETGKSGIDTPG